MLGAAPVNHIAPIQNTWRTVISTKKLDARMLRSAAVLDSVSEKEESSEWLQQSFRFAAWVRKGCRCCRDNPPLTNFLFARYG